MSSNTIGVAILANDRVLDWVAAWLNSFRTHNPSLPATIIPFDSNISRLSDVASEYQVGILDQDYSFYDELGRGFRPPSMVGSDPAWVNMFRKLVLFESGFDATIYLDSDIVVLENLRPILEAFSSSTLDFCFFDETDEYVYMDPGFLQQMKTDFKARLFNAGAWCVKKETVSRRQIESFARDLQRMQAKVYSGYDQPMINYAVHCARLQHGPLHELMPDSARWHWAHPRREIRHFDGSWRVGAQSEVDYGKVVNVLHWAGYKVSPAMPYRKLFTHHRLARETLVNRWSYLGTAWCSYILSSWLPRFRPRSLATSLRKRLPKRYR